MTETAAQDIRPLGLWTRIVGVLTSPTATFTNVVAAPRPVGVLLIVALVIGISSALPQFTEKGQQAAIATQVKAAAQRGSPMDDAALGRLQKFAPYFPYFVMATMLIFLPVMSLFFAAIYWALFNVVLGGTAMFKQALAVVTHSQVATALGVILTVPFLFKDAANFAGPFSLNALAPMAEQGSHLARFLSRISVFSLWSAVLVAIGLGILYRRKIGGILITVLIVTLGLTYVGTLWG
jgi:hypothetical protein